MPSDAHPNPDTIRQHLEAICERHDFQCIESYWDAKAALEILDASQRSPGRKCDRLGYALIFDPPDPDEETSIWDCPDGIRAEKNCRSNCKAAGHSPCLDCMESLA